MNGTALCPAQGCGPRGGPHPLITAGAIATTGDIEVMNPDLVICHLGNPIVRGSAAGVG